MRIRELPNMAAQSEQGFDITMAPDKATLLTVTGERGNTCLIEDYLGSGRAQWMYWETKTQTWEEVSALDTDRPGSPSAPFATTTVRNAAAPFPAGSKPEVVGSPVNTVYQLRSDATQAGAVDADWQVFGAGSGGAGNVVDGLNVKRNGPTRVIMLGDSISAVNVSTGGWVENASVILNGEFFVTYNAAASGATLPQMRDLQIPGIPSWVKGDEAWLQGGTNVVGVTTTNKNAVNDIFAWAKTNNLRLVVYGIPPFGGAFSANVQAASDWNAWLLVWCRSNGVEYRYLWQDSVDPANGGWLAAASLDQTHPRRAYTLLAAKRLAEILHPGSTTGNAPLYQHLYANKTVADALGLVTNPLNLLSAAGVSNGVSFTLSSATNTPSIATIGAPYVARSQQILGTVSAGGTIVCDRSFNAPAGHRIRISQYIALPDFVETIEMLGRVEFTAKAIPSDVAIIPGIRNLCPGNAGVYVQEFVIPVGATGVRYQILLYPTGGNTYTSIDLRVHGEFQAVDLTALGLDS